MRIELLTLKLTNFKGAIGANTYDFNGRAINVYGDNKTGKSTLADAFRWCLFGKNCDGKNTFGISPKDENGKLLPISENEVEMVLSVDGTETTLRRVYVSRWAAKGDDDEKRVVSHTTKYFVNGDKFTEKEYKEYVTNLCSEGLFMVITNPMYFSSLPAEQQRSILTEMIGNVSMMDIAKDNEELLTFLDDLGNSTVEDYLRHKAYKAGEIKKELERIPVRISEQELDLAELAKDSDWAEMTNELSGIDNAIERIDEELADRSKVADSNYERKAAKRNEINALRQQLSAIETEHRNAYFAEKDKITADIRLETGKADAIKREKTMLSDSVRRSEQYLRKAETERADREREWVSKVEDFRSRWADASSEVFTYDENDSHFVCPTCKRRLDEDDIEAEVERMRANWNTAHARKIQQLNDEAASIKKNREEEMASFERSKAECQNVLAQSEDKMRELSKQLSEVELVIEKLAALIPVTDIERCKADQRILQLSEEIHEKSVELQTMEAETVEDTGIAGLREDKRELYAKRDKLMARLSNKDKMEGKQKRIKELEEQEKQLNQQLTELQHAEAVATDFLEAQITELESRVNRLFKVVKFEMFDHKLNNSLVTKCECSIGGVSYADLNNADRINAGIDIINAICKHNNVYAPCFIDNAESINHMLPMACQRIRLFVSHDDKLSFDNRDF